MTITASEKLKVALYDKKMRAEIRENPKLFVDKDSVFKNAEEFKVTTSTKNTTYFVIPIHGVPPLGEITAAGNITTKPYQSGIHLSTVPSAHRSTLGYD